MGSEVKRMGPRVRVGLEVLISSSYSPIMGMRVGLLTNQTGVTGDLRHCIDLLHGAPEVRLAALFSPEHGLWGDIQDAIPIESQIDGKTGLPIYSLYRGAEGSGMELPGDLDALLLDVQDVGVRYYTYIYTMSYAMEAASKAGVRFLVLDRPNPINGVALEGNILNPLFSSPVGRYPIPVRHGMTVGELALLFNEEFGIGADLEVIRMEGWSRELWYDETGLLWIQPSPNMPTLETATIYPGTCLLEGTNVSEGRGTTKPFEVIGAPWIDSSRLALELSGRRIPGALFRECSFTPTFSKYSQERCRGVQIHLRNRRIYKPFEAGLHIIDSILTLHPEDFEWVKKGPYHYFDLLTGTDKIREALSRGTPVDDIVGGFQEELIDFAEMREGYLLYPK
ncbi:MAG: DUF1343 domain-containing protein [Candidatus Bathyarchaeia archaeon]